MMAAPSVYAAINAVSAELATTGIAKTHTNAVDDYKYRSIDDVLERLAPLLAQHRLCILPRVVDRETIERRDEMDRSLFHVTLRVAFSFTSVDDGSSHIVESYGEALDPSDKGTAKAMSAAYKSATVQTFCIPCAGGEEADKATYRAAARAHVAAPPQGWEQWCRDIEDIVIVCETENAIDLVHQRNRELLKCLSRERPDLYSDLGNTVGIRRKALMGRAEKPEAKQASQSVNRGARSGRRKLEDA